MTDDDRVVPGVGIEEELRLLGHRLAIPAPAVGTVDAVMARIDREPVPASDDLRRRIDSLTEWLRNRWRAATVVAVGALLVVLAVSPAGAAIREWLGFGAVVVDQQPPTSTEPTPASGTGSEPEGRQLSLVQARAAVSFPVEVPAVLGEPEHVTVAPDGRMVTMQWSAAGGPVRLDQIDGSLAPYYVKKFYDDVVFTQVDGREALWFARSHPIVLLDQDGAERTESARQSGPSLLWQRAGVTLRLEGVADQQAAVAMAESLSG